MDCEIIVSFVLMTLGVALFMSAVALRAYKRGKMVEREACAKVCDSISSETVGPGGSPSEWAVARWCSDAIRDRGGKEDR